jgi:hypothetical protein
LERIKISSVLSFGTYTKKMKFRRRHLRQLERFIRARVAPLILALLVIFLGTNAFLESAAMQSMHHHACNEFSTKSNSKNSSDKNQLHEHCQFCFAPALASGVPSKFILSRLSVSQTLKLEPLHQIVFNHFYHQIAAPRAPPVQTFTV